MKLLALVLSLFSIQSAYAENPQPLSKEQINQIALSQTQQLMKNPEERKKAMGSDAKAKKVDHMVQEIMGENSEEMYQSAADDFMPYVMKMADGDPKKMNEFIQNALRNPAAFEKNLPPELKAKISSLAEKAKPIQGPTESPKVKVNTP